VYDGTLTNDNRCKIYVSGVAETMTTSGTIPATTLDNSNLINIGKNVTIMPGAVILPGVGAKSLSGSSALILHSIACPLKVRFFEYL
jgi:acetyltransferase-like isoleucine patch superfamily enzyme